MRWFSRVAAAALVAGCASAQPESPTKPFGGLPRMIPGVIEAEHFDEGGESVAWHDSDDKNEGAPYRQTNVDIEARPDASGGYGIGWTRKGEWLIYTVNVTAAGTYRIEMPVASNKKGGRFHIEFNGVDKTGPIDVPDTGGWTVLKKIQVDGVKLDAGRQVMKVVMDEQGPSGSIADIDLFRFMRTP
jgi:hypothetical protein